MRTVRLWKEFAPIISHYRFIEFKQKWLNPSQEEAKKEWNMLHELYSDKVLNVLLDFRGFYIKIGQTMANRRDVMPDIYIEKLRTLEDSVPHVMSAKDAKDVIVSSLGLSQIEDVFQDFSEDPIGSASIGQVHKARLTKCGDIVAVKIQAPGAEDLFRNDIRAVKEFCRVFAPEQVIIFDEIENQFMTEFDYKIEAENMMTVKKNLEEFKNEIHIPKAYPDLCSKHVLTMEYIKGPKLVDGIRKMGEEYAKMQGKTFKELEKEIMEKYDKEGLPPPYSGPSSTQIEVYRKLLYLKDRIINIPIHFLNSTFRFLFRYTGMKIFNKDIPLYKSFIPLNSARIMSILLRTHGHQLLVNGLFNADCHPGNFLLMEDGRIGFLDFGQIKRIDDEDRKLLCELVVALSEKNKVKVKEIAHKTGYKSKDFNEDVIFRIAVVAFDQEGKWVTEGMHVQKFMEKMFQIDPWERMSNLFVMPARTSLLLRGIGLMLNHPVSVCDSWKVIAAKQIAINK
ncbi:ABC1-domain-containing protein [Rozella allomycis CSF55]|uniref:ABC1-domain-containing protein n=1 Tax=Rozella allomycis (strain CSF55) TaxID=988480 RepID=A0A4P9YNK6_ROZAC|nr:ABC1-domain-containing protein [Rozella allomycis CSF55]